MTTPTAESKVVCTGWGIEHGLIVLREGSEPVSHGMCDRCKLFTDASDRLEGARLEEYRTYLQGALDPRD